ncbi:MAG: leucyl aminopeptidase [Saprospiraceae bacterium]|nr:leucyl aminopeptidase [Saprospiraceae bacterium]
MHFSLLHQATPSTEALIVPIAQKTDLDTILSLVAEQAGVPVDLIKNDFKAAAKEVHTLYFTEKNQSKRIFLLGLGEAPRTLDVLNALRSFVFKRKASLPANLGLSFLFKNAPENPAPWVEACVNGLLLGLYDIGLYKTDKKQEGNTEFRCEVLVDKSHKASATEAMQLGEAFAHTHSQIFDLVNAPANKKTPQVLADWAINSGKQYGYKVEVFDEKKIQELGLHALIAVNRGSERPPTFIVMEYKPKGKALRTIGLVGKGVTFDTGGLSIKPSTNMHFMKSDMGGAAAVLGTLEMAAKLKLPLHVVGLIPATENSVDAISTKPGDVIGSYLGKTIEVIDTDAEGRLILADGLAYAVKHYKPDVLVDLATLTGSCIRTLGTYAGGLFSNNDELVGKLYASCDRTGERLWRLPLWDDYKKELKSDVADLKNFSGNPSAGAITAAKFLEEFIEKHPAWAHMDIAGMAVADSEFALQKSATGFGVRLLIDYMKGLIAETA